MIMALPLVATNEVYFPYRDMYEAHDALICISAGAYVSQDDRRKLTPEHYMKSPAEMAALFADLPEAIENTIEIARRCAFRPRTRAPILPRFGAPEEEATELRRQAASGAGPTGWRTKAALRDESDLSAAAGFRT